MKKTLFSLLISMPIIALATDNTTLNETIHSEASNSEASSREASSESGIERLSVSGVRSRLNQQGRLQDTVQKTESWDIN